MQSTDRWLLRWVKIAKDCRHKSGVNCAMFLCYDDVFECLPQNCPKIRFEKTDEEKNGSIEIDRPDEMEPGDEDG